MESTSTSTSPPPQSFSRFDLPGLNLPLNWVPRGHGFGANQVEILPRGEGQDLFRTALNKDDQTALPLITLRELTMLNIMNTITDKKDWEKKVFDDNIAGKWKTEALAAEGRDVTENMMNWVIEELRYKAKIYLETGTINVFTGDVVKSDIAIPESFKKSLQVAVKTLEDIPEIHKDWHPGSDGKVLDLVHPSLFPLMYGRSRVLSDTLIGLDCTPSCGKGAVVPIRGDKEMALLLDRYISPWETIPDVYSKHFQWLPCEVDISGESGVKITSYINNLHPQKYTELYALIEQVIDKSIPLWNKTLTPFKEEERYRRIVHDDLVFDPDPDTMSKEEKPQQEPNENDDDYWERMWQWERDTRRAVIPDAGVFEPPEPQIDIDTDLPLSVNLRQDYGARGLQIIVKLANIELTPSKPSYDGGAWHVEGAMNEHIIATALYYYDSENITESRLSFRQQSDAEDVNELGYPQGVWEWLTEIYGCENDTSAVQEVGSVLCTEGRLITFPNILQHRVLPFSLSDTTKPGHRKILALFLVDPGIRIISTANVPPQQKDWWAGEVMNQMKAGRAIGKLSTELKDKIFDDVDDFPIGLEEAKEVRERLMAERTGYALAQNSAFEGETFSLCEH